MRISEHARGQSFLCPLLTRVWIRVRRWRTYNVPAFSSLLENIKNTENAFICLGHVYPARYFNNAPRRHDEIWVLRIGRNPEGRKRARKYTVRSAATILRCIFCRNDRRLSSTVNVCDATTSVMRISNRVMERETFRASRAARAQCPRTQHDRRQPVDDVWCYLVRCTNRATLG